MLDQEKAQIVDFLTELVSSVEARVEYFSEHADSVTGYAMTIAKEMNLPEDEATTLRNASKLHDIGVAAVSDMVFNKPDSLTSEEKDLMDMHPVVGAKLIAHLEFLKDCVPLIRHHHERSDGKGYPDGLTEDQMSLPLRILIVAQAYDAMIAERAYRKAMSQEEAIQEMKKNVGTQFSPEVVEALIRALDHQNSQEG